jgi:hypothetical protein
MICIRAAENFCRLRCAGIATRTGRVGFKEFATVFAVVFIGLLIFATIYKFWDVRAAVHGGFHHGAA